MDKKRILIVDDSPEDIQIIVENLKDEYAILVATNGQKGLDLTTSGPKVDVVILDVVMPEMDGYEVCRKLKNNVETQDIDVIFVSAHDTVEEKLAGYDAGGSDYLIKPVQPDELLIKVRLAISNHDHRDKISADKDDAIDTAMMAITSAGEQGVVLEFLRQSFIVDNIEKMAKMIVDAHEKYELQNTVQIVSGDKIIVKGTSDPVPPIEKELLLRASSQHRIREHGRKAIIKYGGVSVLIKNMPEDEEKRGRLRDHLAILLEGAAAKLTSLEIGEQLAMLVDDANKALKDVDAEQVKHKEESQRLMDDMLQDVEASFLSWGLTEEQEDILVNLVQDGINKSLDHMEQGIKIDAKMLEIIKRLNTL